MKLAAKQIDGFLAKPDTACATLLYGPDRGLIRQRLDQLAGFFLSDLNDPFNRADLSEEILGDDPARLADELTAMSFTGGRRVVVVRDAGSKTAAAVASAAEFLSPQNAYLILVSDDLSPRDALRKWAEADQAAAALPCYQDDGWSLEKLINETLRGYGLRAGKDVLTWMTHNLGGDRMIILSELEKLSLYMGDRDMVEPADVLAVTDSTRDRQLSELCEAIASRQPVTAMRIYDRLHAEDVQSIAMVRSLSTYFMRLKHLRESVDNGMSPADAVKGYRPPVFFKQQPLLTQQVNSWNMAEIDAFLSLMFEAEIALKSTVSGLDIWLPQTLLLQMQKPRAA